MPVLMPMKLRLLTSLVLASSPLLAQIGDNADKPGFVQVPIVPAELIPPAPALSPEEALRSFRIAPGYRLEIAAAEPLVQEPVAIRFGPDGRLWVVEMRGYMPDLDGQGEDLPVGRIVVLTDQDGDGRYDRSQVFLDNLVLPRALTLVEDGLLVGAPPELAFWRDTNGDGRADTKEVVATDYGVPTDPKRPFLANPERAPNSLLYGHDNWIHSTAYTKKFRRVKGVWQTAPGLFRGQWGLSQDDFGRIYSNSNSDHLRVDVVDNGIGIKAEEQELVFERFYRAKDRRLANITGSGIGLALARQVVRLHGGDITVASAIDKGSTFTITVPISNGLSMRAAA